MFALKMIKIGNSVGAVFPKELLAKLGVDKDGVVYVTDAPEGAVTMSSYDPRVARQLALGEEVMDEFRDTFRALAK